jgi:hypothetical protein
MPPQHKDRFALRSDAKRSQAIFVNFKEDKLLRLVLFFLNAAGFKLRDKLRAGRRLGNEDFGIALLMGGVASRNIRNGRRLRTKMLSFCIYYGGIAFRRLHLMIYD